MNKHIYNACNIYTSIWSPKGVLEAADSCEDVRLPSGLVSVRTSTLTGFLKPALKSSSTASVWVAEKSPVLRSLGNRDMTKVICFWKPISNSLSASSRIKICLNKTGEKRECSQIISMKYAANPRNLRARNHRHLIEVW